MPESWNANCEKNQPTHRLTRVSHLDSSNGNSSSRHPLLSTQLTFISRGLGADNSEQTSVDERLRTIAGFDRYTQERITNSRQVSRDLSEIHHLIAAVRFLRKRLDELVPRCHHLRIRLCCVQDTIDQKQSEASDLAVEYHGMTNERH